MSSSSNIKVHFAGSHSNSLDVLAALYAVGAKYFLLTAFPFIENRSSSQSLKVDSLYEFTLPWKHVIIDSGLFTLMFGAKKKVDKSPEFIREWMHRLVRFVAENDLDASIVEVDCQKIISPEFAWELRREMRQMLPNKEIINVFHLEDGEDGFKRLCEFSDYIAISVPELRIAQPKRYKNTTCVLARLARKIKPGIKIHLLGCTEQYLLRHNRFCTSADSSSWSSSIRFGFIEGRPVKNITEDAVRQANRHIDNVIASIGQPPAKRSNYRYLYDASVYYGAKCCLQKYQKWAGPQD